MTVGCIGCLRSAYLLHGPIYHADSTIVNWLIDPTSAMHSCLFAFSCDAGKHSWWLVMMSSSIFFIIVANSNVFSNLAVPCYPMISSFLRLRLPLLLMWVMVHLIHLRAFCEVVINKQFCISCILSLLRLKLCLVERVTSHVATSLPSLTNILLQRKVVRSSGTIVTVCINTALDILRLKVKWLHFWKDLSVNGYFVKANNDPSWVRLIMFNHPRVRSNLLNIKSFILVVVEYFWNEVHGFIWHRLMERVAPW